MTGYVTQLGANLIAKLNTTKDTLEITSIWGSNTTTQPTDIASMTAIGPRGIEFSVYDALEYVEDATLHFSLYYDNKGLLADYTVTEIGIFATDPDLGEILLAIIPFYDAPQTIPASPTTNNGVRFEFTATVDIILSLSPDIKILIDNSLVFLTIEEALKRFWVIGVKYPATEITETTGTTVEEWQRIQDDRIDQMEKVMESGSTAGTTVNKPVLTNKPYNWRILNYSGWRDLATGTIRA